MFFSPVKHENTLMLFNTFLLYEIEKAVKDTVFLSALFSVTLSLNVFLLHGKLCFLQKPGGCQVPVKESFSRSRFHYSSPAPKRNPAGVLAACPSGQLRLCLQLPARVPALSSLWARLYF